MLVTRQFTLHWAENQLSIHSLFRSRIVLILFIAVAFLFSSCKKGPEPLFTNSVIKGYSETWDLSNGSPGIKVIANGPYDQKSAETGEIGQYFISGLGNGTYRLDYTKEGYGTIKQYGIQLFGNDTVSAGRVVLFKKYDNYKLPVFSGITIKTREGYPGQLFVVIEPENLGMEAETPIVFFMHVNKNVDYKNYTFYSAAYYKWRPDQRSDIFNLYFFPGDLPFKSGTEVFILGYVCNPSEVGSGYFDKYLGVEQFSTLFPEKHSKVMSFIMP